MARRSVRVLRAHPKLLVFPLIGGIAGLAFMATLFGSLHFGGLFEFSRLFGDWGVPMYAVLFVAYFIQTFVASFFSAALVAATGKIFKGQNPTIKGCLAAAWRRKWPLFAWSVIAAVVGSIISMIDSSDNPVAEILAGLFSVAWSVMTYFVVPVIVFENPSTRGMLSRSASVFKNTWGESAGAMGAVNVVTFLLVLMGMVVAGLVFLFFPVAPALTMVATVVIGGSAVLFGMLVGGALTGIAKTALYAYAVENNAPEYFRDMDFSQLGGDPSGNDVNAYVK